MAYRLIITEHAEELIDKLILYLMFHLKNEQAASHLLSGLEHIYSRLEANPLQFPICKDKYLADKEYRTNLIFMQFQRLNNTFDLIQIPLNHLLLIDVIDRLIHITIKSVP